MKYEIENPQQTQSILYRETANFTSCEDKILNCEDKILN